MKYYQICNTLQILINEPVIVANNDLLSGQSNVPVFTLQIICKIWKAARDKHKNDDF